jgi:hypothetical protein
MIRICERCFNPIGPNEPHIRLAHLDQAHRDGSIDWVYSYVHSDLNRARCTPPAVDLPRDRAA